MSGNEGGGTGQAPGPSLPSSGDSRGLMKKAGRLVAVAVLAVVLLAAGGLGLWRSAGSDVPPAPLRADAGGSLGELPVVGAGTLLQTIQALQLRLRKYPTDWRSFAELGLAYVQQGRVTADPSYYPKAEGVLRRSLELHGSDNFEADTGMGALAAARHDFSGALDWARRARKINPYNANVYGVMGDAEIELGRYATAFATLQHMVDLRPDLSSYARVSYARELQGDVPGAIAAMRLAVDSAGSADDAAFADYQLGELQFNSGHVAAAARLYLRATQAAPDYFPPQAALAKVAWAGGERSAAIRRYRSVVSRYPSPEYVIALGDLYSIDGDAEEARREYALVGVEERLFRANGVNVDLELALFDADHGRAGAALREARAEWARRHSIHVADALAWALYANGRYSQALPYADRALSLGYRNALFFFHRGMIEMKLGRGRAARGDLSRAVAINPDFSILHAPQARRALATLGGAPR